MIKPPHLRFAQLKIIAKGRNSQIIEMHLHSKSMFQATVETVFALVAVVHFVRGDELTAQIALYKVVPRPATLGDKGAAVFVCELFSFFKGIKGVELAGGSYFKPFFHVITPIQTALAPTRSGLPPHRG